MLFWLRCSKGYRLEKIVLSKRIFDVEKTFRAHWVYAWRQINVEKATTRRTTKLEQSGTGLPVDWLTDWTTAIYVNI